MSTKNTLMKVLTMCIFTMFTIGTACTPMMNASNTMSAAQFVDSSVQLATTYDEIFAVVADKFDRFDEADQALLGEVDENLQAMIKVVNEWANLNTNTVTISNAAINSIYENSKTNYLLGKEVLNRHMDLFPVIERMQLESFDRNAMLLDNRFELMKTKPELVDKGAFITDALNIGITLGRVLIPILKGI